MRLRTVHMRLQMFWSPMLTSSAKLRGFWTALVDAQWPANGVKAADRLLSADGVERADDSEARAINGAVADSAGP